VDIEGDLMLALVLAQVVAQAYQHAAGRFHGSKREA
jgi:hypothetical protein